MPRKPRIDAPGTIHHVGARGNRRAAIVASDHDRQDFLRLLAEVCDRYHLECGSWCLMTNHYHLILRSNAGLISSAMAMLNGRFARWMNARHGNVGHHFGQRFFNRVLEDRRHRLEVARYIALNPVRAGLVSAPENWPWSSFAAEMGQARPQTFSSPFVIDEWFEGNSKRFRAWVLAGGGSTPACLHALFAAYDRPTAIRIANDAHDISFDEIATHLGISRWQLWNDLREQPPPTDA